MLARRLKIDLRSVPACDALIPESAIKPIAVAVSSIEYPNECAIGATYLKVSPIFPTSVFAFNAAAVNTSANLPAPCADIPKAVIPSVNISDTCARSSPLAAARSNTGFIPANISSVFQPAIPIYFIASALSCAENIVFLPIFIALSRSFLKLSPVAPVIAPIFDMLYSNALPTLNVCTRISFNFPKAFNAIFDIKFPRAVVKISNLLFDFSALSPISFIPPDTSSAALFTSLNIFLLFSNILERSFIWSANFFAASEVVPSLKIISLYSSFNFFNAPSCSSMIFFKFS